MPPSPCWACRHPLTGGGSEAWSPGPHRSREWAPPPSPHVHGTGSHACTQTHARTALLSTCTRMESRLWAWPGPVGPLVTVSLCQPPPAPLGKQKHICQPRNHEFVFSTEVSGGTRHRGTSSRTRGPPLGKWVQEPSPCQAARTVAGHSLHHSGLQAGASARGHLAGRCSSGTLGSTAQQSCPCASPHPLTALLGTWLRQVSGAARAVIAPEDR